MSELVFFIPVLNFLTNKFQHDSHSNKFHTLTELGYFMSIGLCLIERPISVQLLSNKIHIVRDLKL